MHLYPRNGNTHVFFIKELTYCEHLINYMMDTEEFRAFAKATVDYIADYFDNIKDRQVLSSVEPGYLQSLLPSEAPSRGESWKELLPDVDKVIVPGLTHWHSPNFHAYYPTANSFPGIVGELLLSGLGVVSHNWISCPASAELELKMLDWLAKMIKLPVHFLNSHEGPGGGLIQNAASESTLMALLAAKNLADTPEAKGTFVGYTSEQSNSSVEKSGLLASVKMRLLSTDDDGRLQGSTLLQAVLEDIAAGLRPCCVVATLGTTGTCAFDPLDEIGPICRQFGLWLHVDAAYAGAAFACPEFRHLMQGVDFADSFNINPHKWMLVNSDCSAMWFKDTRQIENILNRNNRTDIPDVSHWQLPSIRRFRALKLWFVLRIYGVHGIQKHVRHQVELARYFEHLVKSDSRFEVCTTSMGLVCFRLKGADHLTQELLDQIAKRRNIFVMPYRYRNKLVVRFVICSRLTEREDVLYAWTEILSQL